AIRAAEKARTLEPDNILARDITAELWRTRAEDALAHHRPTAALVASGHAATAVTLDHRSDAARALVTDASLDLVTAAGKDVSAAAHAIASLERARSINGNLAREIAPLLAQAHALASAASGR